MNVEVLEARAQQLEQELDLLHIYTEEKEQEMTQAAKLGKALLRVKNLESNWVRPTGKRNREKG